MVSPASSLPAVCRRRPLAAAMPVAVGATVSTVKVTRGARAGVARARRPARPGRCRCRRRASLAVVRPHRPDARRGQRLHWRAGGGGAAVDADGDRARRRRSRCRRRRRCSACRRWSARRRRARERDRRRHPVAGGRERGARVLGACSEGRPRALDGRRRRPARRERGERAPRLPVATGAASGRRRATGPASATTAMSSAGQRR